MKKKREKEKIGTKKAIFTFERRRIRRKLFRKVIGWHASHTPSPFPSPFSFYPEKIKARGRSKKERWKLITFQRFSTRGKESRGLSLARIIACRGKLTFRRERIYYIIVS